MTVHSRSHEELRKRIKELMAANPHAFEVRQIVVYPTPGGVCVSMRLGPVNVKLTRPVFPATATGPELVDLVMGDPVAVPEGRENDIRSLLTARMGLLLRHREGTEPSRFTGVKRALRQRSTTALIVAEGCTGIAPDGTPYVATMYGQGTAAFVDENGRAWVDDEPAHGGPPFFEVLPPT